MSAVTALFRRQFAALAAILLAVLYIGTAAGADPPFDSYRLGAGDRISIQVVGHPGDSGAFDLDGLGNLAYPPLGRLKVQGRTIAWLRALIRTRLDEAYDLNPKIRIELLNFRPIYIYGEVRRAGRFPYAAGLTVRRVVKMAGGFTGRARKSPVDLIREGGKGVVRYSGGLDEPVLPGDIIEVSRRLD